LGFSAEKDKGLAQPSQSRQGREPIQSQADASAVLRQFANQEAAKVLRCTSCGSLTDLHGGPPNSQGGGETAWPIPGRLHQQPLSRRPATLHHHHVRPPRRCRQRSGPPDCFVMAAPGSFCHCRGRWSARLGHFRGPASGLARHRSAGQHVPGVALCKHAGDGAGMLASQRGVLNSNRSLTASTGFERDPPGNRRRGHHLHGSR
jgi:hypothetical protein